VPSSQLEDEKHYNPLKCHKLLDQQHSIMTQKTCIFSCQVLYSLWVTHSRQHVQ